MRMKHVENRCLNTCFQACIESFLYYFGVIRTQEMLLNDHKDITCTDTIKPGLVPFEKQQILCDREGIYFFDYKTVKNVDELKEIQYIFKNTKDNEGYIFGLMHEDGGGHAVLFDSLSSASGIIVMDPDGYYRNILTDNTLRQINIHKLIYIHSKYSALSYTNYREICNREQCRTISQFCRPDKNERAYSYATTVGEFLRHDTFPVRYQNKNSDDLVSYDHPEAQPIPYYEFVRREDFVRRTLVGWYDLSRGPIGKTRVITIHCCGCNRRIVIDGIHRLTWLGSQNEYDIELEVFELSGSDWPKCAPDINVVCICKH